MNAKQSLSANNAVQFLTAAKMQSSTGKELPHFTAPITSEFLLSYPLCFLSYWRAKNSGHCFTTSIVAGIQSFP